MFLQYRNYSNVLNDERVYRVRLEIINVAYEIINVTVMERNVQCAVKFFSGKLFFQFDDFFVFIIVKIVCLYPKRKFFKSDIGSICAVGIRVV